jgi:hypothetical protein
MAAAAASMARVKASDPDRMAPVVLYPEGGRRIFVFDEDTKLSMRT